MANFFQVGNRVINLELVVGAERENRNRVHVFLAAGSGGNPTQWTFEGTDASAVWLKVAGNRHDLTDLSGGAYSITDNEQTESIQPDQRAVPPA